jgi:hypothetical protein
VLRLTERSSQLRPLIEGVAALPCFYLDKDADQLKALRRGKAFNRLVLRLKPSPDLPCREVDTQTYWRTPLARV